MNLKMEGTFISVRFGCFGGKKTQGILLGFASIPQSDDLRIVFHPMVEQTFRRQKKRPDCFGRLLKYEPAPCDHSEQSAACHWSSASSTCRNQSLPVFLVKLLDPSKVSLMSSTSTSSGLLANPARLKSPSNCFFINKI